MRQRRVEPRFHPAAGLAASLALSLLAMPVSAAEKPVEEIVVTGERSMIDLQIEIDLVEDRMYALFNELNSTDDFDVTCKTETPTGSKIPVRVCDSRFMQRARMQNVYDVMQLGLVKKTEEELWSDNAHRVRALNAEMKALALEHPELANAMLELHAKRQHLAEKEAEKMESTTGAMGRLLGEEK